MTEYCLIIENNAVTVTDANGVSIGYPEFLTVLNVLTIHRTAFRQQHVSGSLKDCQQSAKWVFPKERRQIRISGECIYFVRCSTMPGKIKIGFTNNLSNRTKAFEAEYGGTVEVLAFAKTSQYKLFEEALHLYFDSYRAGTSEWFEETPVLDYLRGLTQ